MNGIVSGGWAFVWAAYIISAVVIFGYATKVFLSARPHTTRGSR